jgi:hypothetical protein
MKIKAIERGDAKVDQAGFAFIITFRGWHENCDCIACKHQRDLFEYLRQHESPHKEKVSITWSEYPEAANENA